MKICNYSNYRIDDDIKMIVETEKMNLELLSKRTNISKSTLYEIFNSGFATKDVYEKFYSYAYSLGYRMNKAKESILKENNKLVLFHASKKGLSLIDYNKSRKSCDFGTGFYLGESYDNSLDFVCDYYDSSIYSFIYELKNVKVLELAPSLEWMLIICYYRGQLEKNKDNKIIVELIKKVEESDVIIAPIADNRMYYIMTLFVNGDINENVAIEALIAANLGNQYVLKNEKALSKLDFVEKYYLCNLEKQDALNRLNKRAMDIDTTLKETKRKYREGRFIEEVLE